MKMISRISKAMQNVLGECANEWARETGFVQRQSKVTGANFCQTLVLGWLSKPKASLDELCQFATVVGLDITPQGLDQRFDQAASDFLYKVLQQALQEVIQADAVAIPLLSRFEGVYIEDSSIVTLPNALTSVWSGFGGYGDASTASVKLQVRWEMRRGQLEGPHLTDGRMHDRVAAANHPSPPPGSLLIRDLGYWKLDTLNGLTEANCFWLSRAQSQTGFIDSQGREWTQAAYVAQQRGDTFDIPVQLGLQCRTPARLVGFRVPSTVAATRRRRLKEIGRRRSQPPSRQRLALCNWSLFVTNLPPEMLSPAELLVLVRLRWQIELLFKLWKSHGHIDSSRSQQPWRVLCEFYAKLIAMILQHWTFLMGNWTLPDRSLVKAAATVRCHAIVLATHISNPRLLQNALATLAACIARTAPIYKSVKTPRTFQLLLDPDRYYLLA